ncbi:MAG: hypothetical protein K9N23_09685 [Akkermansiaceae bacterium]|nr:hypothetical protein [Akkermansiaceae bacterium]MCF7731950.1 hypothetical protein [Akkermansiaceae bacterium]
MAQKSTSGCLTAVVIAAVAALLVLIAVFGLVFSARSTAAREMTEQKAIAANARHAQDGTVVFQAGRLPTIAPHQAGKPVSREQFMALMIDEHATALARETFLKSADQSPVKWRLHTSDISDHEGQLTGNFSLPYQIRSNKSSTGSSISIKCEFAEESRDRLLAIRCGDWVTVQGKLSFSANSRSGVIKEARILDGSYAEDPEER